jgi:hypothetical protein
LGCQSGLSSGSHETTASRRLPAPRRRLVRAARRRPRPRS